MIKQHADITGQASNILGKLHSLTENLRIVPPQAMAMTPPGLNAQEPPGGIPGLHEFTDRIERQLGAIHELIDNIVVQLVG